MPSEEDEASAKSFNDLSDTMLRGIHAVFSNRFQEGEKLLAEAVDKAEARSKAFPKSPDLRSLTRMSWAFVSFFRGLASLESNQLIEINNRITESEEFLDAGPDWIGKSVARCACLLGHAGVLVAEGKPMQGFWKAVRAPMYINDIQRAVDYSGVERPLIRSISLFTTAQLNFLLSYMPRFLLRMASWVTSFTGDRQQAFRDLETTWREGGFLAPSSGLDILGKLLDSEERGVQTREDDWKLIEEVLAWADKTFPGSIFYVQMQSLALARKRKLQEATALVEKVLPIADDYPAIAFVAHQILADYLMAQMDWGAAAGHLSSALGVHRKVSRRAHVPTLARQAAECYLLAGENVEAQAMLSVIESYKGEKKKWGDEDQRAFAFAETTRKKSKSQGDGSFSLPSVESCDWKPRLDVWKRMILHKQLGRSMSQQAAEDLSKAMTDYLEATEDGYLRCASHTLLADLCLQADAPERALEHCKALQACADREIERRTDQEKRLKDEGLVPYSWHIQARAHDRLGDVMATKEALRKMDSYGHSYGLHGAVMMRTALLQRSFGEKDGEGKCKTLEVKAWKKTKVQYVVTKDFADSVSEVSWTFILEAHSISMAVRYMQADGSTTTEVAPLTEYSADDGPIVGSYKPEAPGTLEVVIDNKASWMKSKTLTYCFDPAGSESVVDEQ